MKPKPDKKSWWHKRHVVLALSVLCGLLLVVLGQILYPVGRALPVASIGQSNVGNQSFEQIVELIRRDYAEVPLEVRVPEKDPIKTTTVEAGIVPAYRDAAQAVTQYSLEARLVPFSFVYKMLLRPGIGYDVEAIKAKAFYEKVSAHCQVPAQDAALKFENGKVQLVAEKAGQRCDEQQFYMSLRGAGLNKEKVIVSLPTEIVQATRTSGEMRTQFAKARSVITSGVTVKTTEEEWPVPSETVASWLQTEEKDGEVVLVTDNEKIKTYLDSLRGELYIAPGVTTISYQDGVEVGRVTGSRGQGIDLEVSSQRVSAALLDTTPSTDVAWMQLTVLEPEVKVNRTYTATDRGLQAMIEQWDRERSPRYGILIRDLSGKGLNAQLNPDMDFVTASTYKMFLAYAVLHKVEEGQLSMDTTTDMGLSVRACVDEMILHSTNACATSLMNLAGWSYVHTFIKGQFPSTSLDNGASSDNEKHTTVRDEVNFLERLNTGQLLNPSNTSYLLDLMKRQIYRGGIPKGVAGTTVANKVGFYAGYKHDVAIIYAPRGTYLLGILSYGGNDSQFADLSRRVAELMR